MSVPIPNWGIAQQLSRATSLAFARPETKLGWLTRSAMAVVGVCALGRYGKAPALQIASSIKEAIVAAGTTMRDHSPKDMKLCMGGSSAAARGGLDC